MFLFLSCYCVVPIIFDTAKLAFYRVMNKLFMVLLTIIVSFFIRFTRNFAIFFPSRPKMKTWHLQHANDAFTTWHQKTNCEPCPGIRQLRAMRPYMERSFASEHPTVQETTRADNLTYKQTYSGYCYGYHSRHQQFYYRCRMFCKKTSNNLQVFRQKKIV